MKFTLITICVLVFTTASIAQTDDFDDTYLAENFKLLNTIDSELAVAISPIIEKRLVFNLNDSTTFYNPFPKLSKHVTIKFSEDSLVKTYSWDRINGGSWHDMASYAQYKTSTGKFKHLRLDSGDEFMTGEPTSVIIYDVFHIKSENESYYLLLGWGTYGGGKHHSLARLYKVQDETMVICNSIFEGKNSMFVGANRVDQINLKYNPNSKELSYNFYEFDEDVGFYDREQHKTVWVFRNGVFIKKN